MATRESECLWIPKFKDNLSLEAVLLGSPRIRLESRTHVAGGQLSLLMSLCHCELRGYFATVLHLETDLATTSSP